jgi:hypothetical protein
MVNQKDAGMYIVEWYDHFNGVVRIAAPNNIGLNAVAGLLELSKTRYKVYDGNIVSKQSNFGWGGFVYWMSESESIFTHE